jgi:15-hydroxyprostaglandin dehydrogenase (NAD)
VHGNAGIGDRIDWFAPGKELADGSPEKPDTMVLDICLTSAIWCSYLALHYFRKNETKGGRLVFTSSQCGFYPGASIPIYTAAKHGVSIAIASTERQLIPSRSLVLHVLWETV